MKVPLKQIGFWLGIGLALTLLILGLWFFVFAPNFGQERLQVVSSRLKETHPRSLVSTVEGVYSFVFPYDFLPLKTDWVKVFSRMSKGQSTDWDSELVQVLEIAELLGLNLSANMNFAVIQVQARAGFDFEKAPIKGEWILDDQGGIMRIHFPAPTFTGLIFLDQQRAGTPFPELFVTPGRWTQALKRLLPRIQVLIEKRGLLQDARDHGRLMFNELFRLAGMGRFELVFSPSVPEDEPL